VAARSGIVDTAVHQVVASLQSIYALGFSAFT
jgi:hypothetical protein